MPVVSDTFDRTVSNGWGSATSGQVWSTSGGDASDYSVWGGRGEHLQLVENVLHHSFLTVGSSDQTVKSTVTVPVNPLGGGVSSWVLARMTDPSNYYAALLGIGTTGTTTVALYKRVGGSLSMVSSSVTVGTHAAGNMWTTAINVVGSTVRAKAWKVGDLEPSTWHVTITDSSLATGDQAGVASRREAGNTNEFIDIHWDNFSAIPTEITVNTQDVYPPRALVTVTGPGVGDSIEVYRVVAGERTLLRAGSSESLTDSSFLVLDAEMPFGVPVSYLAVVNGVLEYVTGSTTYTLSGGLPVVTDAISGLAAQAVILAWDEKRYGRPSSRFQVGGRNVVVTDDWGQFDGTIEFVTESTSQRDNLMTVLTDATEGVVQIRQPGGYDGVDSYVSVVGATERRFSQDGTDQRRIIAVDAVETDPWALTVEARGYTLQDIADAYPAEPTMVTSYTFTNTTEGWTATRATLARVAAPSEAGDGSLRSTPTGAGSVFIQPPDVPVSADNRYTVTARVMSPLGWFDQSVFLQGDWLDSGGGFILSTRDPSPPEMLPPGEWTTLTFTNVAPPGAASIRLRISQDDPDEEITTSDLIYVDYLTVETGSALYDLANGFPTLLDIAQAEWSA
ncbi:hypothetical protein OG994_16615 [Micromonospora globbae]|uniref:CBM-cenC domain-containing protein n=1 Tax=Micromonospora globbae TaxID=1894969 RepID=A0ABZ1RYQ2_9ACTN|nr:hypothetical protein [Micromonospora globbae]